MKVYLRAISFLITLHLLIPFYLPDTLYAVTDSDSSASSVVSVQIQRTETGPNLLVNGKTVPLTSCPSKEIPPSPIVADQPADQTSQPLSSTETPSREEPVQPISSETPPQESPSQKEPPAESLESPEFPISFDSGGQEGEGEKEEPTPATETPGDKKIAPLQDAQKKLETFQHDVFVFLNDCWKDYQKDDSIKDKSFKTHAKKLNDFFKKELAAEGPQTSDFRGLLAEIYVHMEGLRQSPKTRQNERRLKELEKLTFDLNFDFLAYAAAQTRCHENFEQIQAKAGIYCGGSMFMPKDCFPTSLMFFIVTKKAGLTSGLTPVYRDSEGELITWHVANSIMIDGKIQLVDLQIQEKSFHSKEIPLRIDDKVQLMSDEEASKLSGPSVKLWNEKNQVLAMMLHNLAGQALDRAWKKNTVGTRKPHIQTAVDYLKAAIASDPDFFPSYVGLADLYSSVTTTGLPRQDEEASRLMRKALEINPNHPYLHYNFGRVQIRNASDKLRKAETLLENGKKEEANQLKQEAERAFKEAENSLLEALELHKKQIGAEFPEVYFQLGILYSGRDNAEAKTRFERAQSLLDEKNEEKSRFYGHHYSEERMKNLIQNYLKNLER